MTSGDKKYSRDYVKVLLGDIRINTGFYQFRINYIVIVTRKKRLNCRSEVFSMAFFLNGFFFPSKTEKFFHKKTNTSKLSIIELRRVVQWQINIDRSINRLMIGVSAFV